MSIVVVPAWGPSIALYLAKTTIIPVVVNWLYESNLIIPMHPAFLTPGDWPIPEEVEWLWKVWLSEKRNPEL